jgi:hypothetical protein
MAKRRPENKCSFVGRRGPSRGGTPPPLPEAKRARPTILRCSHHGCLRLLRNLNVKRCRQAFVQDLIFRKRILRTSPPAKPQRPPNFQFHAAQRLAARNMGYFISCTISTPTEFPHFTQYSASLSRVWTTSQPQRASSRRQRRRNSGTKRPCNRTCSRGALQQGVSRKDRSGFTQLSMPLPRTNSSISPLGFLETFYYEGQAKQTPRRFIAAPHAPAAYKLESSSASISRGLLPLDISRTDPSVFPQLPLPLQRTNSRTPPAPSAPHQPNRPGSV